MEQTNKGLSGNQLKLFAMLAMTVDHFTSVIWPMTRRRSQSMASM